MIWTDEEGIWVVEEGKAFWATDNSNKATTFVSNEFKLYFSVQNSTVEYSTVQYSTDQ